MNDSLCIIKIYGIIKDLKTSNFMMVMQYSENGNLRQTLKNDFKSLSWYDKLYILRDITSGLEDIHKKGLIHQDFHSGNILSINDYNITKITDLGLYKPANENMITFME
ncbi:kinase-like domain-containing protein [Glomus cerebriforme]|uniref:Kinase-like domain-containing protein n=1 Tax=Glomus cerebriforme TaxID=658196 RepID=A0A397SZL3_9GLOM|nr:kinase-like domain-containing protein [Glomus cerebriforme]